MHASTFEYLQPTPEQVDDMSEVREAAYVFLGVIEKFVPEGPDKTYLIRKLREVAMWSNVAISRQPDGSARQ